MVQIEEFFPDGIPSDMLYPPPLLAMLAGEKKYTGIHVPALALFAYPSDNPKLKKTDSLNAIQIHAFETGIPSARVVKIPNSNHYIFLSNEADVLREINSFVNKISH